MPLHSPSLPLSSNSFLLRPFWSSNRVTLLINLLSNHNLRHALFATHDMVQARQVEKWWHRALWSWAVWCHFVICAATSTLIIHKLHHYFAADDSKPWLSDGLRVSDVTTLISVATTLARICATSVTTVASGRSIFILLEKRGLRLTDVQSLASWKAIISPSQLCGGRRTPTEPADRSRGLVLIVALLLLFMVPQQFATPLLTGAVDWSVKNTHGASVSTLSGPRGALALDWSSYTNDSVLREWYAKRASGYAAIAWAKNYPTNATSGTDACRHIVDDRGLVAGSTLHNSMMPHIVIHNISWEDSNLTKDPLRDAKNISSFGDDVLRYYQTGNAVLFDPTGGWDVPDQEWICYTPPPEAPSPKGSTNGVADEEAAAAYQIADSNSVSLNRRSCDIKVPPPKPQTHFDGRATLLVLLSRQNITGCNPVRANAFGNLSEIRHVVNVTHGNKESCYAVATVSLAAGVVSLPSATYIDSRVVQGNCGGKQPHDGPWVTEALSMMPDVMTMVSVMNATRIPTWNSLDGYARTLIKQSYSASWDSLYSGSNATIELEAFPLVPRIQASVSRWRVSLWLGLNLLLLVAAALLRVVQERCSRSPVHDVAAALLMTEIEHVTKENKPEAKGKDRTGNLSIVTARDSAVRLKLEEDNGRFYLQVKDWVNE